MPSQPIQLRIRNLQTREVGVAGFETEAEAFLWLKARPRFVEVMGMAGQANVPAEVQERLRAAMRPLDGDERLAEREMELLIEKEDLEREKAARAHEVEAQAKHQETMRTADPERLMEIRWRFDSGMILTDAHDTRSGSRPEIPLRFRDSLWVAARCSKTVLSFLQSK